MHDVEQMCNVDATVPDAGRVVAGW